MADESGQEKTEEPTSRRLDKAREDGSVARSKELAAVVLLVGGMAGLMVLGPFMLDRMKRVFELLEEAGNLRLHDSALEQSALARDTHEPLVMLLSAGISLGIQAVVPLLAVLLLLSVAAGSVLGGMTFASKPLTPDLSKLDPLKGLGRMFSLNSLVELVKAVLKFTLVVTATGCVLYLLIGAFMDISRMDPRSSISAMLALSLLGAGLVAASLLLIVAIDVPWQMHQHNQKLKMTRQEVKDEFKDTEGKPEVKGRIRELQRQLANRRMLDAVPEADVVVTNPDHYAVALRYRVESDDAPIVVAKGADEIAMKIREIAKLHRVECLEVPPLARSLYRHAQLDKVIPRALFVAVAQVLAHVHQLRAYRGGKGVIPGRLRDIEIPGELQVEPGA